MKKLIIVAGMLAALLVAAAPALGQQGAPPVGVPPNQPEEVTVTGVVQPIEREPAFIEGPMFTITNEETGDKHPIIGGGPEGIDLSQFVGERVTVTGVPDTQGQPISGFENPDELPLLVTEVEPAGGGTQQGQYTKDGGTQEDQYADDGAQQDQYDDSEGGKPAGEDGGQQPQAEPEPAPDQEVSPGKTVTDEGEGGGSADDGKSSKAGDTVDVLPDTGGPSPLLAVGALVLLGSGIAGLSVARRRAR